MRSVSGPHPESAKASPAGDPAAPPFPPSIDASGCAGAFDTGPLQAKRRAAKHAKGALRCAAVAMRRGQWRGWPHDESRLAAVDTAEACPREGDGGVATWLSAETPMEKARRLQE